MWKVVVHRKADKQLRSLPKHIVQHYMAWAELVTFAGPDALGMKPGYRDEALKGKWNGCRSSRLSMQYRVIYRVDAGRVEVMVLEVNAHAY